MALLTTFFFVSYTYSLDTCFFMSTSTLSHFEILTTCVKFGRNLLELGVVVSTVVEDLLHNIEEGLLRRLLSPVSG